ncbi:TPA_asm: RNA-directed RNA polymerase [ssRNA phage SRR6960551_5]|uniref:RNA-directed RNA polymerase n=1 Tax=ssRNA phage SRR6960551_5 TaxID=2786556 RepID=A0A8S5L4K4_9VIRU|nr:RNA-directed RNA polymerase [ssRNA phage SRR6960551_5]DAD52624.1 TPA_asm: RNA-directed RNA polymerase [ssRNA phage SRR6960551_5]
MKKVQTSFRNFYKEISLSCLEAINTPFALSLRMQIDSGSQISEKPNPSNYIGPHEYLLDAQAYAIITKNQSLDPITDLLSDAYDNFYELEKNCKEVNERLSKIGYEPPFVQNVRDNIQYLIGKGPNLDLPLNNSYMGPGATSTNRGEFVNQLDKLSRQQECTIGASKLASYICRNTYIEVPATFVAGSSFNTVPKSFKTLRPINVEPGLNMICQKFLGSELRRKLLKAYNLDTQHTLHGYAAHRGSVTGDYATIDLKNASDTISYRVVKELFPEQWFSYLNSARSHKVLIQDKWVNLEKFSSMGNGSTFELETILFLGILMTLPNNRFLRLKDDKLEGDISVFGDDIIVRSSDANLAIERLEYFGFSINNDKSFLDGPFRESCGRDYYLGVPVRPIYMKGKTDDTNCTHYYVLANSIYRMSILLYGQEPRFTRFSRVYAAIMKYIPVNIRAYGPEGYGDVFLISSSYTVTRKHGLSFIRTYKPVMRKRHYSMYDWTTQLMYATLSGDSDGAPIRGSISRHLCYKFYIH